MDFRAVDVPDRIRVELEHFVQCTQCGGYCSDHHACVVQFEPLGAEYNPFSCHWVCSAACLLRVVQMIPVSDNFFVDDNEAEE